MVRVYTYRQWLPWRTWYALGMDQRICALDLVRERMARPVKRIGHFRDALMRPKATLIVDDPGWPAASCCCEWCRGCHQ